MGNDFTISFFFSFVFLSVDITFSCLGSWPGGPNGSRYIALRDNQKEAGNQPQYRCGVSIS